MKRILSSLFLALALTVGLSASASAQQALLNYDKFGTSAVGVIATAFCVIDSLIPDGTVVIADTTTTGIKRIGVRPYAGTTITRPRILGIAVGDIQRSSNGSPGKVLLWGYHPNAKMSASGSTANTMLKTAPATHGALAVVADSLSGQVGIFIGYNSRSTVANSRGKVFITQPLGKFFATL